MAEELPPIELIVTGGEEGAAETSQLASAIADLATKIGALGAAAPPADRAVKGLADREKLAADSARDMAQHTQAAVQQSIQFTQRIAGAASAVQGLTAAFGQGGATAGLIARIAQSTAAMAQLGASFGPQGAVVGGIVGFLLPAIQSIIGAQEQAEAAAVSHRQELQRLGVAAEVAASNMREFNSAASRIGRARGQLSEAESEAQVQRALSGTFRDASEADLAVPLLEERRRSLEGQRGRRGGSTSQASFLQGEAAGGVRGTAESAVDVQIAQLDELIATAREASEVMHALERTSQFGGGATAAGGTRRRVGPQIPNEPGESINDTRAEEELLALGEQREALIASTHAAQMEADEYDRERALERKREIQEQMDLTAAAAAHDIALIEERQEREAQAVAKSREAYETQVQQYQAVTSVIVGGLTDALSAIISGQKSAEEAFLSLLAGFLKFISEQAAIKAAFEFAEAIASIPAAPLVASHLAAGIAFTAVAALAGAGSAVAGSAASDVAAKQSAANEKPASPESRSGGASGGGGVNVYLNSPVMMVGTKDELGRAMGNTIAAAQRRYGGGPIQLTTR